MIVRTANTVEEARQCYFNLLKNQYNCNFDSEIWARIKWMESKGFVQFTDSGQTILYGKEVNIKITLD